MPLGRQKDAIATVSLVDLPFVVRFPSRRIPATFSLAWLFYYGGAALGAPQTLEQCGDAATRGYRLRVLADGTMQFTTWNPGAFSVATVNAIGAGFNLVQVNKSASLNSVLLNGGTAVQAAGTMAAPTSADDRILGASDSAGADVLLGAEIAQAAMAQVLSLALSTMYDSTRRAQRLREQPGATLSYIDFGRVGWQPTDEVTPGLARFGDDVTGARIEALGLTGSLVRRADRVTDWATP